MKASEEYPLYVNVDQSKECIFAPICKKIKLFNFTTDGVSLHFVKNARHLGIIMGEKRSFGAFKPIYVNGSFF